MANMLLPVYTCVVAGHYQAFAGSGVPSVAPSKKIILFSMTADYACIPLPAHLVSLLKHGALSV